MATQIYQGAWQGQWYQGAWQDAVVSADDVLLLLSANLRGNLQHLSGGLLGLLLILWYSGGIEGLV